MKTNVYVDGFNLFYGLLKGTPFKWLDLEAFCDLLLPKNDVEKIYYFSALVEARQADPRQPARQFAYLEALASLPRVEVHLGSFMASEKKMPLLAVAEHTGKVVRTSAGPVLRLDADGRPVTDWVLRHEEKGSDVNLASYLLRDAYLRRCDCAVIVSNDSDLLTPIRLAKSECSLKIGLVPPRPRGSVELKALADFKIDPRRHHLERSQFPEIVHVDGRQIVRPQGW